MYTKIAANGKIKREPIPNPGKMGRGNNPGTSLVMINPISEEEYRMLVGKRKKNITPSKYNTPSAAKQDAVREALRKNPHIKPNHMSVGAKAGEIYSTFFKARGKEGLERGDKWGGVQPKDFWSIYSKKFAKRHKKIIEKAKNKTELEKMMKDAFAEKGDPKGPAQKKGAKKPAAKKPAAKKAPAKKAPAKKAPAKKAEKPQAVEITVKTETPKAKKTEKLGKTLTKKEIEKLVKDGAISQRTFKALCGNIEQFQKWTATELGKVSKKASEAKEEAKKKPAKKKTDSKEKPAKKKEEKKEEKKEPAKRKKNKSKKVARKRNPSGSLGELAQAFLQSKPGEIAMQVGGGTLGYMIPGLVQMGFKKVGLSDWMTTKFKMTPKTVNLAGSSVGFVGSILLGVAMQKNDYVKKTGAAMAIGAGIRLIRDIVDAAVDTTTDTKKKIRTAFGLAGYDIWRPAYPGMGAYQDWYLQMSGYGMWRPAMSGYASWRPALGAGPAAGYQLGRGPSPGYQLGAWKGNWQKSW